MKQNKSCTHIPTYLTNIFKDIVKNAIVSIGTILILIFLFLNYKFVLKYIDSNILYSFLAKEIGIENYQISEHINNQIEIFYNVYKDKNNKEDKRYGNQFSNALQVLVDDNYPNFLQINLKEIKPKLDDKTYNNIKLLYYDLSLYWINLRNGSFGTDVSKAFESYFLIIDKYKCKFPTLRKDLHSKDFLTFNRNYYFPIDSLLFEIYLRTFSITTYEADTNIKTNARFLFDITQRNLDATFMILSSDTYCDQNKTQGTKK